ncbi:MAG: multidrug efflux RND transporter permease subunit [Steroidobacteraceae bacterium]|nr:multidrug efflux RND transporter permease subunit [Steroidobacteraceae bacterium]
MLADRFIDRPILAVVVSTFILIAGLAAFRALPISLYPDILPPQVEVTTAYPGASAEVVAETVAAPLEQQINGVEDMLYLRSASSAAGTLSVAVTFAVGTDPDLAVINVQNRVQAALPLLPEEVRRQGVVVRKSSPSILKVIALDAPDGRYDALFVSNYALVNVVDEIRRIPGVGAADVFGAREYAIRIWLRPDRLAEFGLTPGDVASAVREQNSQSAAGRLGDEPLLERVDLTLSVTTQGRLSDPEQFRAIVLRAEPGGRVVRLGDVARVELGARDYSFEMRRFGRPTLGIAVFLAPNANALEVATAIDERMERLAESFPAGLEWSVPYDTSLYVRVSMQEVAKTLLEAMVLVFVVVLLFLHRFRSTLIPMLVVPVSLVGALAGLWALGLSLNSLTLFGMVLAIGIVVDDAIVVLENVERHMRMEHVDPKEATRRALAEVTRPVIAIVLVLNAVFVPVAFLGGLVGEMYRQFAITISIAVTISGFVALTLTPALCALLLDAHELETTGWLGRFERGFQRATDRYVAGAHWLLRRGLLAAGVFGAMIVATWGLVQATPAALLPEEDQGYVIAIVQLQPGASLQRTQAAIAQVDAAAQAHPAYRDGVSLAGLDILTFSQRNSSGVAFLGLKDWSERGDESLSAGAVAGALMGAGAAVRDAFVFALNPPAIPGLSAGGGFEGFVQARAGGSYAELEAAVQRLAAAAARRPEVVGVTPLFTAQVPRVALEIDRERAKVLGVSIDQVNAALQATFGAFYVNDFNRDGRVYRVLMQSEAAFRAHPEDLADVYVRGAGGEMVPLTAVARAVETTGPDLVERYDVFPAARIRGDPAPGYSSGQALDVMERLAAEHLPEGYTLAWTGQAFQERAGDQSTAAVLALAVLMVFLILAAQYERLSLPFAVILAVPFAAFGAFLAVWLRGLHNDVYLQVGLVTLVGLAAKNAILIVEFAAQKHREGLDHVAAVLEAARLRFRPIVMTSLAFVLGVVPLALSTGAGAASRHSIGTGVIGGMIAATTLAILFVPLFYLWVVTAGERLRRAFGRRAAERADGVPPA